MLKTLGYLISTLSVIMLGAVSWEATATNSQLRFWLVAGVAASIIGMLCRWLSYQLDGRREGAGRGAARTERIAT